MFQVSLFLREGREGPVVMSENEDGTHSGFRNVVDKFTSHTVQKPVNQKTTFISRWNLKWSSALSLTSALNVVGC